MLNTQLRSSAAFRAPTTGPVSVALSIVDEHGDNVPMIGWKDATVAGALEATATIVPATDPETADPDAPEVEDHLLVTTAGPLTVEQAGLHRLELVATDPSSATHQLQGFALVVEREDGWHTNASARDAWADAPTRDGVLWELLDAARVACIAYAPLPAPVDGVPAAVPTGHRQAQLNVARAIWQRSKAGGEDTLGMDAYAVRVYIDDPDTRRLLRPRRIRGGIA